MKESSKLMDVYMFRKVSLNDISQKKGMELRLVNGIAYSESWFSRWGYKFGRGSYGVTQSMYQKAIEAIRSMPLYLITHHITNSNHAIPLIFSKYQTLSDQTLVTLGDLFSYMLDLKSRLPPETCIASYSTTALVETNCRWSPKRIEMATRVIVEALKKTEFRWVSRQEVRDAARAYIGDTGLLDFVLKSLGNHVVGNYLVRRSLNPVTKVLEYCLEDISKVYPCNESVVMSNKVKDKYKITRTQVMKDMLFLYKYILIDPKPIMGSEFLSAIPLAARIILDTKYFIRDYWEDFSLQVEVGSEEKLNLYCTILVRNDGDGDVYLNKAFMPPYECVILKRNSTVNELKVEVERRFREIYWGLKSFVVESVQNLSVNDGTEMVFGVTKVGEKIVVEGRDSNMRENMIEQMCERDPNSGAVDCSCGTIEDDGERMVSCDICEILQHTRCVRIPNDEEIPHIFLCKKCEQEIVLLPSLP